MGKLTLAIIRAVKDAKLDESEIIEAIAQASKPKPEPKPTLRRRYTRRDMQAEA